MTPAMVESPFWPTEKQVEERMAGPGPSYNPEQLIPYYAHLDRHSARAQLLRENLQYARLLCEHVRQLGYAPFASHLLYPQFLPETPEGRASGLECRDAWAEKAGALFFGVDLGWSRGMIAACGGTVDDAERCCLFPSKSVAEVRAHLASLPWREFVEL